MSEFPPQVPVDDFEAMMNAAGFDEQTLGAMSEPLQVSPFESLPEGQVLPPLTEAEIDAFADGTLPATEFDMNFLQENKIETESVLGAAALAYLIEQEMRSQIENAANFGEESDDTDDEDDSDLV